MPSASRVAGFTVANAVALVDRPGARSWDIAFTPVDSSSQNGVGFTPAYITSAALATFQADQALPEQMQDANRPASCRR